MAELYEEKRAQELHGFENMAVVHDLPAIHHYWSKRHLLPKLKGFGVKSIRDLFVSYLVRATVENVTVVSLGALMKEGAHPKQYKHLTPQFCVRWP
jgi:hypothetical protein